MSSKTKKSSSKKKHRGRQKHKRILTIRGVIPWHELKETVKDLSEAFVLAYDPETKNIVAKTILKPKDNKFSFTVPFTSKTKAKKLLIMWECVSGTILNQIHPIIRIS